MTVLGWVVVEHPAVDGVPHILGPLRADRVVAEWDALAATASAVASARADRYTVAAVTEVPSE